MRFLAKGSRGTHQEPDHEDDVHGLKRRLGLAIPTEGQHNNGDHPPKRQKVGQKERKHIQDLRNEVNKLRSWGKFVGKGGGYSGFSPAGAGGAASFSAPGGKGANKPHPQKDGKGRFLTNEDGVQLCFAYHTSGCRPTSCPNQRAHQCQLCLGFHQNSQCTVAKRNGKGAGDA